MKNLIFDMGNVLVKFVPEHLVKRCSLSTEDEKLLLQEVFYSGNWKRHDLGELDEKQLYELSIASLPERLHPAAKEMIYRWSEPLIPIEGMAQLIKEMKEEGRNIYLLSNAGKDQPGYWNKVPGSEYFDGTVVSALEGCIKPDPKIYRILVKRYSLDPAECLFIDDMEANTETAQELGWKTYCFDGDVNKLKNHIRKILEEERNADK
ncbi:MAG: HAD family phosphatase [Erysipelotrichaceae bacterium]|nr:HAD family phosphatase [Erysipelotrichaceae bacterium]